MKTKEFPNGIKFVQFSNLLENGFEHAIFSRHGGVSNSPFNSLNFGGTVGDNPADVLENHEIAFNAVNLSFSSRFDVWQVHGTDIVITDEPRLATDAHQPADGILTRSKQVTLIMRFADCVSVLVADPVKKIVGIYHAGWQGTLKGIGEIFVERMVSDFNSDPGDLVAGIGPSICGDCYEVGEEFYEPFSRKFGIQAEEILQRKDGKLHLDLWKANQLQLIKSGVENIEIAGICTAHNTGDWFSHRAENGKTGRFGVLITLAGMS